MRPLDIAFRPAELATEPRAGISLRWLGTAGFELCCDGTVLLIDPHLTRASLLRLAAGPLRPDHSSIERHIGRADAIIVSHSHFDHLLDVPAIAHRTGATVFGSRSTMAVCRSAGILRQQTREIEPDHGPITAQLGPFAIEFDRGEHSPLLAGRVPFVGEIRDADSLPLRAEQYRCGTVLRPTLRVAGKTIVHMGSGALPDGDPSEPDAATPPVDLLLLCVPGWHTTHELPERVVRRFAPRAVLLMHWDNFFRPLDGPTRLTPGLRTGQLVRRLQQADPGIAVGSLPVLGELQL